MRLKVISWVFLLTIIAGGPSKVVAFLDDCDFAGNCNKINRPNVAHDLSKDVDKVGKHGAENEAILSIASDFEEYKKTLSRDINVFHWTKSPFAEIASGIYASQVSGRFSKVILPKSKYIKPLMLGEGLYAATDPSVTRGYGDKLLQLKLKKGDDFLQLAEKCSSANASYEIQSFYISLKSQKLMKKAGCEMGLKKSGCITKTDLMQPGRSKCYELFKGALKKLDIAFIGYKYATALPNFCKSDPKVAFIMVKSPEVQETYNQKTLQALRDNKIKKGTKEYKKYIELFKISRSLAPYSWTSQKHDNSAFCNEWGSRLFGCNCSKDKTYSEDQIKKGSD